MDILKKIRQWLEQNDEPPWPVGLDFGKASDAAKFAVSLLTEEEFLAISRHNRFKCYRNEIMGRVKRRHGIPVNVLQELCGLSIATVKVIVARKRASKNG